MSKIKAYYCTKETASALFSSAAFDSYVSNDPGFWISTYSSETHVLLLVNGDDRDHTVMSNQSGINDIEFDDIREGIETSTPPSIITKAVNNVDGLELSDFAGVSTVRDVLTVIIQHLEPGACALSFDNAPRPSGTFTDAFTGTNGDDVADRTGWTTGKDGAYSFVIYSNNCTVTADGGGSGESYITCTDQGSANHYVQAVDNYFNAKEEVYLAARLVDEDNFIGYHLVGTGSAGARLCKMVAGTLTDLPDVAAQGAAGYAWKVECDGNTVRLFRDTAGGTSWTQIGSNQTISDHNTETSAGLVANEVTFSTSTKWDNFENGTIAATSSADITAGVLSIVSSLTGTSATETTPYIEDGTEYIEDGTERIEDGIASESADVDADSFALTGSLSGTISTTENIDIYADSFALLSSLSGDAWTESKIDITAPNLAAVSSLSGTVATSNNIDIAADLFAAELSITGDVWTSDNIDLTASALGAESSITGTVWISGGIVAVAANPLISELSLSGDVLAESPVELTATALTATTSITGDVEVASPIRVIADSFTAVSALSGTVRTDDNITIFADELTAQSSLSGTALAHSYADIAADSFSVLASLSGTQSIVFADAWRAPAYDYTRNQTTRQFTR